MFNFHVSAWGHGSNFIDADLKAMIIAGEPFITGWQDVTPNGFGPEIIIWLRGGGTS